MDKSPLRTKEFGTLIGLSAYFFLLALLLYFLQLGQLAWDVLVVSAVVWFIIGVNANSRKRLVAALKIGAFLLVFDFIFQNAGWLLGLWQTHSVIVIGVVPIEVMGIAFFGGTAWALYLPRKFNMWHSLSDCVVFALGGSLGEWLLIHQGLFVYRLWWTSMLAFAAYFLTWMILHFVRYRVFREGK